MTTYTLLGVGNIGDKFFERTELEFVVPDKKKHFSYEVLKEKAEGDPHNDVKIVLPKGGYMFLGEDSPSDDGQRMDSIDDHRLGNIVWEVGTTPWLRVYADQNDNPDIPNGYFSLAEPNISSNTRAEWEAVIDSLDIDASGMITSGPLRPGVKIKFKSLLTIDVREEDNVTLGDQDDDDRTDDWINTGKANDQVRAGGGNDTVLLGTGDDTGWGDDGDDILKGGAGNDFLNGDDGNDKLDGGGGKDGLDGGNGNDILKGGGGKDNIFGSLGDDRIIGGGGNDELTGGGDSDVFVFAAKFGKDVIDDFTVSGPNEVIDLKGVKPIKNWKDLKNNHLTETADGDALIKDKKGNTITVIDVSMDDLSRDDFLF